MNDFDEPSRSAWERRQSRRRDTRPTDGRPTSRLAPGDAGERDDEGSQLVNPEWRSGRLTRNRGRRSTAAIYNSPQQVQIWLQKNKWIFVALGGIAVLIVALLIYSLQQTRSVRSNPFLSNPAATTEAGRGTSPFAPQQPTITVDVAPPSAQSGAAFEVVNTSGQGLFLRAQPSTSSTPLETLPEGTRLEQIGDDQVEADFVWRHVRAPSGQEGWVAVDFLQSVP